ncbi:MAG: hypothetical protein Q9164_000315 [Protoblastenia rupestris]
MAEGRSRAPEGSAEYEELFNAANDGDINRLEAALLPSLDVNALEADPLQGRSALHVAAQAGNVTAIHFLLSHGAQVDLRNSEGETPLHEAAFWARPDAVRALLDAGADLRRPTGDYSFTALHNVLKHKNAVTPEMCETIAILLDRGLDVNAKADSWGSTLIGQACLLHSLRLVQMLADRDASLDTALSSAADDQTLTRFLLGRGARIVPATPGKGSALADAAGVGKTEVIRLLLAHADALHWAAARGREDAAKLLIENGFDVNRVITDCPVGETPLLATCAVRKLSPERLAVAKVLIDSGADVYQRGGDGQTPAELLWQSEIKSLIQGDKGLLQRLAPASTGQTLND